MNQNSRHGKSPALAGFLSVLPGMGQAYVGHYLAGFTNIVVIGSLISILEGGRLGGSEPLFTMFMLFFWVFNIVDAVRRAQSYNDYLQGVGDRPLPTDSPLVGGIILTVLGVLLTLRVTFGFDLRWVEHTWPLLVLGVGLFLVRRYIQTRDDLRVAPTRDEFPQTHPPIPSEPAMEVTDPSED